MEATTFLAFMSYTVTTYVEMQLTFRPVQVADQHYESKGYCFEYYPFIIHLRLNNVQQSMGKPGTQVQLIKTRILYSRSREKSVLVLLVTREIRIMYSKSRALQQIYVRDYLD